MTTSAAFSIATTFLGSRSSKPSLRNESGKQERRKSNQDVFPAFLFSLFAPLLPSFGLQEGRARFQLRADERRRQRSRAGERSRAWSRSRKGSRGSEPIREQRVEHDRREKAVPDVQLRW